MDDIRVSNPPNNAPLLAELGRKFGEEYGYDQRQLVRDICLSRTYQMSPSTNESNRGDDRYFSHSMLRRVRADILYDMIHHVLDEPIPINSSAKRSLELPEGGRGSKVCGYFLTTFGQGDQGNRQCRGKMIPMSHLGRPCI